MWSDTPHWGERFPIERCPTRINPEIIKLHEVQREENRVYGYTLKSRIGINRGVTHGEIAQRMRTVYPGTAHNDLTDEQLEELIMYVQNKKKRKPARMGKA